MYNPTAEDLSLWINGYQMSVPAGDRNMTQHSSRKALALHIHSQLHSDTPADNQDMQVYAEALKAARAEYHAALDLAVDRTLDYIASQKIVDRESAKEARDETKRWADLITALMGVVKH